MKHHIKQHQPTAKQTSSWKNSGKGVGFQTAGHVHYPTSKQSFKHQQTNSKAFMVMFTQQTDNSIQHKSYGFSEHVHKVSK
jgi:hypothetical protein